MATIIGVSGTNGAGKGAIVDRLTGKFGFKHFSVRAYITNEIEKRGLPVNRDSMILVGNALRQELGDQYMPTMLREVYESGENYIVESIRTPSEVLWLNQQSATHLFSVDADRKLRYERAVIRKSETDQVSFEKFCEQEETEMQNTDPNKQNLSYCMEHTDPKFRFTNNGSLDELHAQIDAVMPDLLHENKTRHM